MKLKDVEYDLLKDLQRPLHEAEKNMAYETIKMLTSIPICLKTIEIASTAKRDMPDSAIELNLVEQPTYNYDYTSDFLEFSDTDIKYNNATIDMLWLALLYSYEGGDKERVLDLLPGNFKIYKK